MGKQPYIPFYVGDYLKDTRALPLSVRGAWVDMILFMWDNPVRGELIGTIEEVARMIGCDKDEARFALDLLKQKKTADIELLSTGEFKIVSRRMKRDAEISEKRSIAGKNGVKAKFANTFAQPKGKAKTKQIPDIENDNEVENDTKIGGEGGKIEFENLNNAFDELTMEQYTMHFKNVDVIAELADFKLKVKNAWADYRHRDVAGFRNAFQFQLKTAKPKINGNGTIKNTNSAEIIPANRVYKKTF